MFSLELIHGRSESFDRLEDYRPVIMNIESVATVNGNAFLWFELEADYLKAKELTGWHECILGGWSLSFPIHQKYIQCAHPQPDGSTKTILYGEWLLTSTHKKSFSLRCVLLAIQKYLTL